MILIKLSVDNVRLLQKASSEPELRGAVNLVLMRVAEAATLKSFGKAPTKGRAVPAWKVAQDTMSKVLGSNLIVPPFPAPNWYQRIQTTIKEWGLGEAELTELAEYAKTHMRLPVNMSFLITQHQRVLAGEWNQATPAERTTAYNAGFRKDSLPDD